MNNKGFSKVGIILSIIVIVIVVAVVASPKKSEAPLTSDTPTDVPVVEIPKALPTGTKPTQTTPTKTTTSAPVTKGQVQFTFPKGGEKLEAGKIYTIGWSNYSGTEPLTIVLQTTNINGKVSLKDIGIDIPAASVGSYSWTAGYEGEYNRYKIGIFPTSKRSSAVYSKEFYIVLPWGSQSSTQSQSTNGVPYAVPSTGQAPLNIGFVIPELPGYDYETAGIAFVIDYGDKSPSEAFSKTPPFTKSHMYTIPGTYTAVIKKLTQCSYECLGPSEVISQLVVKVNQRP